MGMHRWFPSASHLLRSWVNPRRQVIGRVRYRKLTLQVLEDRIQPATVNWIGTGSGDWDTKSNWSTGALPGPGDDVVINQTGITITHSTGTDSVQSVTTNANVILSSGTLNVSGGFQLPSGVALTIQGGTLGNATVNESAGALLAFTSSGGVLNAVTINGDMDLTRMQGASVTIYGGLPLNGTLYLGNAAGNTYGRVYFANANAPAGALTGNATVVFGGWPVGGNFIENDSNLAGSAGTLTIGSGVTIHGTNGSIYSSASNGSVINQGTINLDTTGGTFKLGGNGSATFVNQSPGTINVSAGTLGLYGTLTLNGLGTLNRTGGAVYLTGRLDLGGGTLNLNATSGSWTLQGGTIENGTIDESDSAELVFSNAGGNTLSNIAFNGDMDLTQMQGANVTIYGGLPLNGTLYLGNAAGNTYGRVYFANANAPAGALTGNATVVFGAWPVGGNFIENDSNLAGTAGTLTIGSGVTIHGTNGSIYSSASNGSVINQGTINLDTTGGTFKLGGNGSTTFVNQNPGTINVSAGTLGLYGNLTINGLGTINRTGGSVYLTGTLDLGGGTLNLNAASGSWTLQGGTIENGTIDENDGAELVFSNGGGNTLSNVVVNGDMDLTQMQGANVTIYGGLPLNGTLYLGNAAGSTYGRVYFANANAPAGALTGNATVMFGGWDVGGNFIENDSNLVGTAGTLTIASTVTIHGTNGSIYSSASNGSVINQGTINLDTTGGTFKLGGNGDNTFINQSPGTIDVSAGTLGLYGDLTLNGLGTINRTGGSVYLTGTLDLSGGTLNLNATSGSWTLQGGTIENGTIDESDSAELVFSNAGGNTLSNIAFNGDMDLTQMQGANVTIFGGLPLNGTLYLGNAAGSTYGRVYFANANAPAGALTGNATVVFGGWPVGGNFIENDSNLAGAVGTLTIASTGTIHGTNGSIYSSASNGSVINQGTINLDTTGGTFKLGGNGSTTFVNQNPGTINVSAGTLGLYGSLTLNGLGTINRTGGSVYLTGTLDLGGGTLNLNAASGSWTLQGGTIENGTINESDGAELVFSNAGGNTLSNIAFNGDMDLTQMQGANVTIYGGLPLNGTLYPVPGQRRRQHLRTGLLRQRQCAGRRVDGQCHGRVRCLARGRQLHRERLQPDRHGGNADHRQRGHHPRHEWLDLQQLRQRKRAQSRIHRRRHGRRGHQCRWQRQRPIDQLGNYVGAKWCNAIRFRVTDHQRSGNSERIPFERDGVQRESPRDHDRRAIQPAGDCDAERPWHFVFASASGNGESGSRKWRLRVRSQLRLWHADSGQQHLCQTGRSVEQRPGQRCRGRVHQLSCRPRRLHARSWRASPVRSRCRGRWHHHGWIDHPDSR